MPGMHAPSCMVLTSLILAGSVHAETTIGLLSHETGQASEGYTFFCPMSHTSSYLIDLEGRIVHQWDHDLIPGNAAYLLNDGSILRTANPGNGPFITGGGQGGIVTCQDWDGTELWSFELNDEQYRLHHDVEPMPNGHVLMIAWERMTAVDAIAAGRATGSMEDNELWSDVVIEVKPDAPGGPAIVWQWRAWDHLAQDRDPSLNNYVEDLSDHPELIDINFYSGTQADWLHLNAIDFHPALDQILLSCPRFKEIWILDHSTTTEEAAGHVGGTSGMGGDLLYRWGNARTWHMGSEEDQKFFAQHGANWIGPGLSDAGQVLVFNNGVGRPGPDYSTVESLELPLNEAGTYDRDADAPFGPDASTIVYSPDEPGDLYAAFLSGAQRLSNDNTLICDGPQGRFLEITPKGEIVWEYVNPVDGDGPMNQCEEPEGSPTMRENNTFRVLRYPADFPGFIGHDLTPTSPIELYPGDYDNDQQINVTDLLTVIALWGDPWNIEDLLLVIAHWGGCR